jgi:pimeloyl-ACP methyl ester carboxylesterase
VRSVPPFHAEVRGAGPRIVFVHGSVGAGAITWGAQRELAARFTLVILDRPGYPPNPPLDRIDFGNRRGSWGSCSSPETIWSATRMAA